jgi:hypothetical protein
MYRVRFHLAAGKHHRMWQVRHPDGSKTYHDPATTTIFMEGCYLRNSRRMAERIHAGANKSVCAWVLCREVTIRNREGLCCHLDMRSPPPYWQPTAEEPGEVRFNPRIMPHWHDRNGTDLDGTRFLCVMSYGRELFGARQNLIG